MAFYPRAAILKWKSEWDGQALELQTTWSPMLPENWVPEMLDPIADALFEYIGNELNTPIAGAGFGAALNDWLSTVITQTSCEIYLMQGGFNSMFFRKVFPMNVAGQRATAGTLMPSFNAVGFNSATTEYQKKPSDFRLYGLYEADVENQEITGAPTVALLDTLKAALNLTVEDVSVDYFAEGAIQNYLSSWRTTVVTRLKVVNPDDPTDIDYVLPSQPGDPVFATLVTDWDWSPNVTSQISRKRRKNNA